MIDVEVALQTDRGGRDHNEDACGHWRSDQQLCCVLADGAGGHGGGDIAARLAVSELIASVSNAPVRDPAELVDRVRALNDSLRAQRQPGTPQQDMHSTVVCLWVDLPSHRAVWAHVGDSRLYRFRAGRLQQRTRDHSLVQGLVDAGLLNEDATRSHAQRSELRSALGVAPEQLEVGLNGAAEPLAAGDILLLCTDGVWEYVDDPTLESTLAEAVSAQDWLSRLTEAVRHGARHKARHDNFTALAVWVHDA